MGGAVRRRQKCTSGSRTVWMRTQQMIAPIPEVNNKMGHNEPVGRRHACWRVVGRRHANLETGGTRFGNDTVVVAETESKTSALVSMFNTIHARSDHKITSK